jgi:hypothetical protein
VLTARVGNWSTKILSMKYILSIFLFLVTILNCQSQELVPFHVDTLWGYKDKQGTIIIEPQYRYATKFRGDVAIVSKNRKLGAIDRNNKIIVPIRYEFLRPLDTAEFLFGHRAKYFGEHIMGVMTKDERVKIPAEYNSISKFRNHYLVTTDKDSIIGKGGIGDIRSIKTSYGLCDNSGKLVIPCKYGYISWKTDSVLVVDSAQYSANHRSALFNSQGKRLTGFDYLVIGDFKEGLAKARIENKYGFLYPTGKVAIPIELDYCEEFTDGYAMMKHRDKWGAIDKNGKIIIKPKFTYDEVKTKLKKKNSQ